MNVVDIVVRDIDGQIEMRAVEALQKEVWGLPDLDVVPLTQLVAAKASGGVLIGAFDRDVLAGFAYGFVGYEDGHVTHHSHMLAVLPTYRNLNVGYRLKLAQRDFVLAQGINEMTWTFDPLQSLNAYFNFNRLGVISDRYFTNFYGDDAASFLHGNGTDRLWVTWRLDSARVLERLAGVDPAFDSDTIKPLVELADDESPTRNDQNECFLFDQTIIEIPSDVNFIERENRDLAAQWRASTRWAFAVAMNTGYLVQDFQRVERNGKKLGRYHLSRGKTG